MFSILLCFYPTSIALSKTHELHIGERKCLNNVSHLYNGEQLSIRPSDFHACSAQIRFVFDEAENSFGICSVLQGKRS